MSNNDLNKSDDATQTLVDELIWVRSMLRVFSKLEAKIHNEMGENGIRDIVLKENYFLFILIFSIFISGLGVYLFIKNYELLYFSTLLVPIISFLFLNNQVKKAREKNLLRFISKLPSPDDNLLYAIEEYVFQERDYFEDIIAWHINKYTKIPQEKFSHLFDPKYWNDYEKAQLQCSILAVLMVSLQQYLHIHKRVYLEHVKKLPIMNEIQQEGYKKVQSRLKKQVQQNVAVEDIQTFGGGFGFTKEN